MLKNVTIRATLLALTCTLPIAAYALAEAPKQVDIPAGELSQALLQLSKQYGADLVYRPEQVHGLRTQGAHGELTTEQAATRLLEGTRLEVRTDPSGAMLIAPPQTLSTAPGGDTSPSLRSPSQAVGDGSSDTSIAKEGKNDSSKSFRMAQANQGSAASDSSVDNKEEPALQKRPAQLQEVVVTGTHIKGAPPASPVIEVTQQRMQEAGQHTLADVIRSIPQNFSGGQVPGIAIGASTQSSPNSNTTGGTAPNLRGLGPDATLTLLNGRRLAYDSFNQSIDISTIPVAALDRIEIVADGASAIYGSDAVAGVVNVILKRDYDGLDTSARIGGATDGGDAQQEYGVVAGRRWSSGGFIATYDYNRNTAIYARQRDYVGYLLNPYMLLPSQISNSVILSGHQEITPSITFSLDALYNKRHSEFQITLTGASTAPTDQTSFSHTISPSLNFALPGSWSATLNGLYGKDRTEIDSRAYSIAGALLARSANCYCNWVKAAEADAQGVLFDLPAGAVRVDVGAGYRETKFQNYSIPPASLTAGQRHTYYTFGELFLPFVSPAQNVPVVHSLSVSVAERYERYSDFGGVATPKVGLIYEPSADFDIKGSWGQSFKTPTLSQTYSASAASLYKASTYGGIGYPGTATVIATGGGNPNLKAETATTYTATIDAHPGTLPGFQLMASYFGVDYKDRIITPIPVAGTALSNPAYADFITYGPSLAQQNQTIGAAAAGLVNFSGTPYAPANVVAIVKNYAANAEIESIHGVDLSSAYEFDFGGQTLQFLADASWLESRQKRTSLVSWVDLAGTVYNPPHFRSRDGVIWNDSPLTLASFVNFTGGVSNAGITPRQAGGSMTTVDLSARYAFDGNSMLKDFDVSLSLQNIFDTRPPYLKNAAAYYVNYDSTNYSAVGRLISLSLIKRW